MIFLRQSYVDTYRSSSYILNAILFISLFLHDECLDCFQLFTIMNISLNKSHSRMDT